MKEQIVSPNNLGTYQKNFARLYFDFFSKWNDLFQRYSTSLADAAAKSYDAFIQSETVAVSSKKIQNKMRATFDSTLRNHLKEENFITSLNQFADADLDLAKFFGVTRVYSNFIDIFSAWNRVLEPIRDTVNRTSSEVIDMGGKFHLLHYKPITKKKIKTPVLIVYSLINRHYILDLLPEISVVRSLLKQGFDVYATDWGTPVSYDKNMTLENYTHEYVENAVNKIKEITGVEKVSIFGYCWGGIFALIYSAIHPETVQNLILHAAPIDFGKTDTVIEKWTKSIDAEKLVDTLGNVPGPLLNLAFLFRNPVEVFLKYYRYFSEPRSLEEIQEFFAVETWLYDNRPIMGEVYKEIVNEIYKKNLLIQNKLKVGNKIVNLQKITMPVLNILGLKDDLVPLNSSRTLMSYIPSSDKQLIEFPTGHIGLCFTTRAHEELWPEVGKWIAKRSQYNKAPEIMVQA